MLEKLNKNKIARSAEPGSKCDGGRGVGTSTWPNLLQRRGGGGVRPTVCTWMGSLNGVFMSGSKVMYVPLHHWSEPVDRAATGGCLTYIGPNTLFQFFLAWFFLRDFIFKKTLFEKLQYLKQDYPTSSSVRALYSSKRVFDILLTEILDISNVCSDCFL